MPDKKVEIDFVSKARGDGAQKTKREVDKLDQSVKKATRTTEKKSQADKKAEHHLDQVKHSAQELRRELEKSTGYDAKTGKSIEKVADQLDRVDQTGRKAIKSQDGLRKGTRRTDLAMLSFSQAVEDAQYGIRGVLNNIPPLIQQLGGTAGLAGVISLSAVALTQLGGLLFDTGEEMKDLEEEVDALEEYFKDLNDEVEGAKFDTFIDHLNIVDEILKRQNVALRANIKLMAEKRNQELALAAAQDDLARAEIALRLQTDPEYTEAQANEDRSVLDQGRLQRERLEKIRKEQDELLEAERARKEAVDKVAIAEEKIAKLKEKQADDEERLFELQRKERTQRLLRAHRVAGLENEGSLSRKALKAASYAPDLFLMSAGLAADTDVDEYPTEAAVQGAMSSAEKGEMAALSEQVKANRNVIESMQSSLGEAQIEAREAGQILDVTQASVDSAVKSIEDIGEFEDKTFELGDLARQQAALAKEAADTASRLVETVDRENLDGSAKISFDRLEQIIGDDIDNTKQLGGMVGNLADLQKRSVVPLTKLQAEINFIAQRLDQLEREKAKSDEVIRRLSTRRP